jgi:hypothetical protein
MNAAKLRIPVREAQLGEIYALPSFGQNREGLVADAGEGYAPGCGRYTIFYAEWQVRVNAIS